MSIYADEEALLEMVSSEGPEDEDTVTTEQKTVESLNDTETNGTVTDNSHYNKQQPKKLFNANSRSTFIRSQEPMSRSRSMQLHYISVTALSWTDLFLDRIYFE